MKSLYLRWLYVLIITAVCSGTSYGGNDNSNFIDGKETWKSFDWSNIKKSKLFNQAKWKQTKSSNDSESNLIFYNQMTHINSLDFDVQLVQNIRDKKIRKTISVISEKHGKQSYDELLKYYCGVYGKPAIEYDSSSESEHQINYLLGSQWNVGNTTIQTKYSGLSHKNTDLMRQMEINGKDESKLIYITYNDKSVKPFEKLITLQCNINHYDIGSDRVKSTNTKLFVVNFNDQLVLNEDRNIVIGSVEITENKIKFRSKPSNTPFEIIFDISRVTGLIKETWTGRESIDGKCEVLNTETRKF